MAGRSVMGLSRSRNSRQDIDQTTAIRRTCDVVFPKTGLFPSGTGWITVVLSESETLPAARVADHNGGWNVVALSDHEMEDRDPHVALGTTTDLCSTGCGVLRLRTKLEWRKLSLMAPLSALCLFLHGHGDLRCANMNPW